MADFQKIKSFRIQLTEAAEIGDIDRFSYILSLALEGIPGFDLNYMSPSPDSYGFSSRVTPPLIAASGRGYLKVVEFLVQREDVKVNIVSDHHPHITPLSAAAAKGYVKVMKVLINNGADVDYVRDKDSYIRAQATALYEATHNNQYEAAELLLKSGASVNNSFLLLVSVIPYADGNVTSSENKTKMKLFKLLLEYGADINATSPEGGKSLLILVCGYGSWECARLLIERGVDVTDKERHKGLLAVVMTSTWDVDREFVTILLDQGVDVNDTDDDGKTPLMLASSHGDIDTVQLLLSYGGKVDTQVLLEALQCYYTHFKGNHEHFLPILQLLLNHAAEDVIQSEIISSFLVKAVQNSCYEAANSCSYELAKLLLQYKVNADTMYKGTTALIEAVLHEYEGFIKLLLDHGAQINIRNSDGNSALIVATQKGQTKCIQLLLGVENINVDSYNKSGESVLMIAARYGHNEISKLLLDHGANPNLQDSYGNTALMIASQRGNTRCVEQLLLKEDIDVNQTNDNKCTALMLASESGNVAIVQQLLEHGAELEMLDVRGCSALFYAVKSNSPDVVELFLHKGADFTRKSNNKTLLEFAGDYHKEPNVRMIEILKEACKPSDEKQTSIVSDFQRVATPLTMSGIDTSAPAIWELNKIHDKLNGEGIVIAIIGSGVNYEYKAFTKAFAEGRLRGRRYLEKEGETTNEWGTPMSSDNKARHGTMAAFVAGGEPFGDVKSGGIAPKSTLWICSVGATIYHAKSIINALKDLIKMKKEHNKFAPDIISMSFGLKYNPDDTNQQEMARLIKHLRELGVVMVTAAGNSGKLEGGHIQFPASELEIICVGAHDQEGYKMDINPPEYINCFAPGEAVIHPDTTGSETSVCSTGTSCAAPAIAGLIALLFQFSEKYVKNELERKKFRELAFLTWFLREHRKGGDSVVLNVVDYLKNEILRYERDQLKLRQMKIPEIKYTFHLLLPLASNWQNIGVLLGISTKYLDSINEGNKVTIDCLREMLKIWLKSTDPLPTWSLLAEAVEPINSSIAEEICQKYCSNEVSLASETYQSEDDQDTVEEQKEEAKKNNPEENVNISEDSEDESNTQNIEDPSLEERFAAIKKAMKEKGTLKHTLSHGMMVGPARSGKSSLMSRLAQSGKMPISHSPSTGVADKVIQVVGVQKSQSIALSIQDTTWYKLLYDQEAIRLMKLATQNITSQPQQPATTQHTDSKVIIQPASQSELEITSGLPTVEQSHVSEPRPLSTNGQSVTSPFLKEDDTAPYPEGYIPPMKVFKAAIEGKDLESFRQHFENSWTFYLTDTGGQVEFQEVIPLLVSGPSVFFFTFRLDQDLNQRFTIEYHLPEGGRSKPYQSTLTVVEAILQTLASITSFIYKGPHMQNVLLKPKMFIVGTHKDKLDQATADQSEIKKIDQFLQGIIMPTTYYREDIIHFATESQLIYTVNNFSEDDLDFKEIRLGVECVVFRHKEFNVDFPTHWLIFSLVLRQEMVEDSIISYEQCFSKTVVLKTPKN